MLKKYKKNSYICLLIFNDGKKTGELLENTTITHLKLSAFYEKTKFI